jgi:hypothetical protein
MNELQRFIAATQARITYSLLGGFIGLMFALLVLSVLPVHVDDKLLSIMDRIITALLPIVGGTVGFWTARHRPTNDDKDQPPAQPQVPTQPAPPA